MKIFGKTLSEYISFQKMILWLVLIVGLARLALSMAGVRDSLVTWLSLSAVGLIGLVYYSIRVHTSGFGSYKQLLPLLVIQSALANAIVVVGIVIAIVTQKDNIFSKPEYSGGVDGKTWLHVGAHIIVGIIVAPVVFWLIGSLLMLITKKVAPSAKDSASAAGA